MECRTDFSLRALNTFGVEAIAAGFVRFDEADEIPAWLDQHPPGGHRLVLGGGSNLLLVDDFDGVVLQPALKGIDIVASDRQHVRVRVMAGENWDDLVAHAVENGWGGIENLSLIPGSVGASAVQNIGAYGAEVKDVIERVDAIAMDSGATVTFSTAECGFGYRFSHFKGAWNGRYIITAVVFRLSRQPAFVLGYPGVRDAVAAMGAISLSTIRRAVIAIRKAKLPDPEEVGNAGSFFKNPVVDGNQLDRLRERFPDLPDYPQGDDRFKLPAGWLIERCGWKGKRIGRAGVHERQALVLVNSGGATGKEILALAERVEASVADTFGIALEREVLVVP